MKFLVGVLEDAAEYTLGVYHAIAQKFVFLLDIPRFFFALLKLAFCFLPGIVVCHLAMHNSSGHTSTGFLMLGIALKIVTAWLIVQAFRNSLMQQRRRQRRRRYYLAVSPATVQTRAAWRRKSRLSSEGLSSPAPAKFFHPRSVAAHPSRFDGRAEKAAGHHAPGRTPLHALAE